MDAPRKEEEDGMAVEYQVVYWRAIPAQIRLREGKRRSSRELSPRFQEAIDQAAMRAGLAGTDAYLNEWRTTEWNTTQETVEATGDQLVTRLENEFPSEVLKRLAAQGGLEAKDLASG